MPQEVEGDQGHRVPLREPPRPVGVPDVHPVGEGTEGRHSLAERDHLAVEQEVVAERRERVQLGEGDGDVVLVARPDAEAARGAVHEDAHAVPLHLVGPARTGHVVALGGEHRQHTAIQAGAGSVSSASPSSGHPDHMRAIWKGAVSFGLVSVPVKLYSATESKDISFRQVHAKDGGRIKYQRTCSLDGEEVEYADIAKGYETEDGEMVILTDEDMEQLPANSSREISVEKFVPSDQIDPMLFEKSYYLEPEKSGAKPYALLREALEAADRMALVTVSLRNRTSLAVLRVRDDVIVMQTMMWPDEIREADFGSTDTAEAKPAEVKMAKMLVETLAGDFDPSEFEDDYREAVEADGEGQDRGRRGQEHPRGEEVLRRGRGPACGPAAQRRRRQDGPRRGSQGLGRLGRLGRLERLEPRTRAASTKAKKSGGKKSAGQEVDQEDREEDRRQEAGQEGQLQLTGDDRGAPRRRSGDPGG